MVKVVIEQILELDEDLLLEMINITREWNDLEEYEKFEDIPSEELETWISENEELIREEMDESDYVIKQIIITKWIFYLHKQTSYSIMTRTNWLANHPVI